MMHTHHALPLVAVLAASPLLADAPMLPALSRLCGVEPDVVVELAVDGVSDAFDVSGRVSALFERERSTSELSADFQVGMDVNVPGGCGFNIEPGGRALLLVAPNGECTAAFPSTTLACSKRGGLTS